MLTVTNGSVTTPPWDGSAGSYPAGTVVSIAAGRASAGHAFKEWVIDVGGGVFASQSSETTAFTTTLADTTIRATYHNVYPLSVTDGTDHGWNRRRRLSLRHGCPHCCKSPS